MHSLESSRDRVFYSKEHKSGAEKSVGTRNEVLYNSFYMNPTLYIFNVKN